MKDKLAKFKEESKNTGMPEASIYLLRKFQSMFDDLSSLLGRSMRNMTMACATVDTVGGSSTEEFLDPRIKSSMYCAVSIHTLGESPVSILSAKCEMGKIVVTFSDDPSDDHKLTYIVNK